MNLFINLIDTDPVLYFTLLGVVIFSIVLHELGHALAATWQGDSTAKMMGHLTWDPRVHMGTVSLVLAAVIGIAFGATPVNPRNFRNRRWGDVMVSFAGPVVNLVLGIVAALSLGGALVSLGPRDDPPWVLDFLMHCARLNLLLFAFNLIPVPPFDGFTVAKGFVNFGSFEKQLRSWHPMPMILAFVLVVNLPVWGWADQVVWLLARIVIQVLGGA